MIRTDQAGKQPSGLKTAPDTVQRDSPEGHSRPSLDAPAGLHLRRRTTSGYVEGAPRVDVSSPSSSVMQPRAANLQLPSATPKAPMLHRPGEVSSPGPHPLQEASSLHETSANEAKAGATTTGKLVMQPLPANDNKFPLRDPSDALQRAHSRYAADDGSVHKNVKLKKIRIGDEYAKWRLEKLSKTDPRLQMDADSLKAAVLAVTADAQQEFQRLIDEEPLRKPRCHPRVVGPSDVAEHEQVLVGQHGLFVQRPDKPSEYPPCVTDASSVSTWARCLKTTVSASRRGPRTLEPTFIPSTSGGALGRSAEAAA
jgi:hypothetical protein